MGGHVVGGHVVGGRVGVECVVHFRLHQHLLQGKVSEYGCFLLSVGTPTYLYMKRYTYICKMNRNI